MSGADLGLAVSVFLACTVEAVEALTIVLAVGTTRSWPSALGGAGAAVLALAALIAAFGSSLTELPIDTLRLFVGGVLLLFGLQWLRKAILRAAGLKAKHDELETYELETSAAHAASSARAGFDGYSFTIAFKGVLLEGLEVAFIVLTFGANQHRIPLAAVAAGVAIVLVTVAGIVARAPLARVPENTMKFAVGVMLSSFGIFWGAEGAGASWPGGDGALLVLIPGMGLAGLAITALTRARRPAALVEASAGTAPAPTGRRHRAPTAAVLAVWEFIAGDDWRTALGVVLALGLTAALAAAEIAAWWTMPLATVTLLAVSVHRVARARAPAAAQPPSSGRRSSMRSNVHQM